MHSRNQNGWGRLFAGEDLEESSERTDPNLELPHFDASEEKTKVERSRGSKPKLKLPTPGEDRTERATPRIPSPVEDRPRPLVDELSFSSAELVGKLEGSDKVKKADHFFTKELIATAVAGMILLGAAIAYTVKSRGDDQAPQKTIVDRVDQPPILPAPEKAPELPPPSPVAEQPVEPPVEAPKPAAVPILSIISDPSGASVEIDGTVFGKTPMIERVPNGPTSLTIRLTKDKYKRYDTVVQKNEAGHYNLNVKLEPAASR